MDFLTIYRPSNKALRGGSKYQSLRTIFRQGCALLFDSKTGKIIQSDLAYKEPDSMLFETKEKLSQYKFLISKLEKAKADSKRLWLPPCEVIETPSLPYPDPPEVEPEEEPAFDAALAG